jgi:hypothetical protein
LPFLGRLPETTPKTTPSSNSKTRSFYAFHELRR